MSQARMHFRLFGHLEAWVAVQMRVLHVQLQGLIAQWEVSYLKPANIRQECSMLVPKCISGAREGGGS